MIDIVVPGAKTMEALVKIRSFRRALRLTIIKKVSAVAFSKGYVPGHVSVKRRNQ